MTCQDVDARMDEWLDGTLPRDEVRRLEEHLEDCAACAANARALRRVVAHARALPRAVSPDRDLWPDLERRIAGRGAWVRILDRERGLLLAAAAAVVLAVAAITWLQSGPGTVKTAEIPAPSEPALGRPVAATRLEDPVLAQAERDYEDATNALLERLQGQRGRMNAETLARVEENLQVIDRALEEVRQAIARNPRDPELNHMLVATHRKKVDVLRRVVRLSTEL